MRIAFLSDIHSNILALEAVLKAIKKHQPERIVSLGDQVNIGPCPRETLELLNSEDVFCLHGNHERYILSVMEGDSAYNGANFNSLRYNASLLTPEEITFPKELRLAGGVLCTHAMPEDDRFPVFDPEKALPMLACRHDREPIHIICGHGHNPTSYRTGHLTVHSIGSVGCMDDGVPGCAPYAIAEIEEQGTAIRPYYAQYDTRPLRTLFKRSGMAEYCPVMARIACMQMEDNHDYLVGFVQIAAALAKQKQEQHISEETWREADMCFPWADGLTAAQFWKGI